MSGGRGTGVGGERPLVTDPNAFLGEEMFSPIDRYSGAEQIEFAGATLTVPDFAFSPDGWSREFLNGLKQLETAGKTLVEIGVGTGAVAAGLLVHDPEIKMIYGSDLEERLLGLAQINCNLNDLGGRYRSLSKPHSLLDGVADEVKAKSGEAPDIIYACIPQVGLTREQERKIAQDKPDEIAHYYVIEDHPSELNSHLLGLNDTILGQAAKDADDSQVVLNLAGRPGETVLKALFIKNGFTPEVLHKEVVKQDPGTDISPFVNIEKEGGHEFHFYSSRANGQANRDGSHSISATKAQRLKDAGKDVYHSLYVILGTKNG